MSGREERSINRREVAYRLFAAEFEDSNLEYSDSEEERAPNYVVTPTGARVNRLFVVGVLTEVEPVSDDVLRARVVDPTGAFVVYAGQYQPEAVAFLEAAEAPSFVAVTGKARTFRPEGGDRVFTSVRPETVTSVDSETRDRWTVQAAEHTLARVATMASALDRVERGGELEAALRDAGVEPGLSAGIALAIDHYGTTAAYLAAVREQAVAAAEVVAGNREEAPALDHAPDEGGAADADLTAAPAVVGTLGGAVHVGAPSESATLTTDDDAPSESPSEPAAAEPSEPAATESGSQPATASGETGADPVDHAGSGDASEGASDATDELGDFADYSGESGDATTDAGADRYELDEAEREAVEAEYDTEFSTAGEVGDPGEAGIEPEAEQPTVESGEAAKSPAESDGPVADDEASVEGAEDEADEETEAGKPAAAGVEDGTEPEEPAADVDLEAAAVEAMTALDDGDGADREAVVAAVVDAHGVDPDAVEAAVQDALMDGRCYEPADGTLKAI